ncbi:(d)CMP kinase [Algibacter sp. 2305UL17-15]|uniref:(d)CMP kinase n=1 Tax=Algibacter sp. 2305UL17-15 TaxID=3231268 RepID=UPI00345767BD
MNNITIAIDGYSSTGKSTVAKQIAKHLGYVYVDSGAMYRAVTLYAIKNGLISEDDFNKEALVYQLDQIELSFQFNDQLGFAEMYLNGLNVEKEIRTLKVSSFVSKIAEVSKVRQKLVGIQKKIGQDKGVVMDGRDIGTVVFPDAELKIFMTASAEKRAERRYQELKERGDAITYEAVLQNVTERDYIDTHREDSPLVKAEDAIEIDNSDLTLNEQYTKILELVKMTLEGCE